MSRAALHPSLIVGPAKSSSIGEVHLRRQAGGTCKTAFAVTAQIPGLCITALDQVINGMVPRIGTVRHEAEPKESPAIVIAGTVSKQISARETTSPIAKQTSAMMSARSITKQPTTLVPTSSIAKEAPAVVTPGAVS